MILGFKKQFVPKILDRIKIHTIRIAYRWSEGTIIHMATGVRTKNYNQFNKDMLDLQVCTGVQNIDIKWIKYKKAGRVPQVRIDRRLLTMDEVKELAVNDGFDDDIDFFLWFDHNFQGQIVHWTDYRY